MGVKRDGLAMGYTVYRITLMMGLHGLVMTLKRDETEA
jgi:hypothetical protein